MSDQQKGVIGSNIERVLEDVQQERWSQIEKWGYGRDHSLGFWTLILLEELGEAARAWISSDLTFNRYALQPLRNELVQATAVLVAMIEYIDRKLEQ